MTATEQNEFYKNLCRILGKQASSVKRVQEGVYCWRWLVRQSEFCVYLHGNEAHELGLVFFNQKRLSSKKERNTTIDVIIQEARAFADDHSFKTPPPRPKNAGSVADSYVASLTSAHIASANRQTHKLNTHV